jgi:DNA ligase-1
MITERDMTLGMDWRGEKVTGWYVSEKLDGCRAYWDGETLWSRSGKVVQAPAEFLSQLPAGVALDGKIYCGPGQLKAASNAVRLGGKHWAEDISFVVFDAPGAQGSWPWRLLAATEAIGARKSVGVVSVIDTVTDKAHVKSMLADVLSRGGEGLMLRNPDVEVYERKRTANLLKVKRWPR